MIDVNKYIKISDEVKHALDNNLPIVALESTIISHGMPYPENYNTTIRLEKIVRDNGSIPAVIAIIDGVIHVGITNKELEFLSLPENRKDIVKVSRRDLPAVLGKKLSGATTVASTMLICNLVGIEVFATGGIGGVHRNAEVTMDISADLEELASTNVTVVCAGVKSILDIGLTLEYLETKGVPIYGFKTNEFPAFYLRESGYKTDYCINSPYEYAQIMKAKKALGLKGGQVVANPVFYEYEIDKNLISDSIAKALIEAEQNNIKGKEITPFLLSRIAQITQGKSLTTNIELVCNNAKVASLLASAMKEDSNK